MSYYTSWLMYFSDNFIIKCPTTNHSYEIIKLAVNTCCYVLAINTLLELVSRKKTVNPYNNININILLNKHDVQCVTANLVISLNCPISEAVTLPFPY